MAEITRLSNGLRVVSQAMPGMSSVSLGAWIGVGSRYETDALAGVSHFLEHLLFKGTRTRTAKQITEEIEGVGGSINAFTSEEHTCYTAKVHHRHTEKGMEILSDMMLDSTLQPKEVERERDVIQEEILMSRDNPGEYAQELLSELVWPHQSLGRLVIGTPQSIRDMKRASILAYKARHYVARNIVLAGAGNVEHAALVDLARRWFEGLAAGEAPAYTKVAAIGPGGHRHSRVRVCEQKTEQVHLAMALPGCSRAHPQRAVLRVLSIILGGNMSSRLFQEVREKNGFAYDIGSSAHHFHDTGTLVIYAGTEKKKLLRCLDVVCKVLADLKRKNVPPEELRRAKEYASGRMTLGLEKSMERMLWLGEEVISLGEIPQLQRAEKEIEDVTAEDVRRMAMALFKVEACRAQAVGHSVSAKAMQDHLDF